MDGDGHLTSVDRAEAELLAAVDHHGGLHLAGDHRVARGGDLRDAFGVVQISAAAGEVFVDVGLA